MNTLVRIIQDDDGAETFNQDWHLVDPVNNQGPAALCTQEFYGFGESDCVFEEKTVERGGVTCENCLRRIRIYKAIKL